MIDIAKLVKFSKKTEVDIKKEIEDSVKRLEPIEGMTDQMKLDFAMNELFSKYSKEQFGTSRQFIKGFFIGLYNRMDNAAPSRKEIEDALKTNPEAAKKLCLISLDGKPLYHETQDKFTDLQDWQLKKRFREAEKDEEAFLTRNGKKYIGLPIPLHDYARYAFGFYKDDVGAWISFVMKMSHLMPENPTDKEKERQDNTSVAVPLYQFGEFPVFKVDSQSTNESTYFTASGKFEFKFERAIKTEEIEAILKSKTITELSSFNTIAGGIKSSSYATFKARVQDIGTTDNGSIVLKVYDNSLELGEKDEKGEDIVPISCYPSTNFELTFSDGAEIFIFGRPYISNRNAKIISACGIYVSPIYKNLVPKSESIDL